MLYSPCDIVYLWKDVKALRETVALSLCRHSERGGWVMEDYFAYLTTGFAYNGGGMYEADGQAAGVDRLL